MTDDDYADVRTLIRAHDLASGRRVDVDDVIRRGRRSRRIRLADRVIAGAAVVAVVASAALFASRSATETSPPAAGTPVELQTSDWAPGDSAQTAELAGSLTIDDKGCLVVTDNGRATAVIWPRGYTARTGLSGRVEVLMPDGRVAAHTDDPVVLRGGSGSGGPPMPCPAAYGRSFTVQQVPPFTGRTDTPTAVLEAIASAAQDGPIHGIAQWVESTELTASGLTSAGPGAADVRIYIVQVQGDFTMVNANVPSSSAPVPHGTVMLLFVPVHDTGQGGSGVRLSDSVSDLSAYGRVLSVVP